MGAIGVGLNHLLKGVTAEFLDDIDTEGISACRRRVIAVLGVAALVARSFLLGIAGYLFMSAAWSYDADDAAGIDECLRTLASAPLGRLLLGVCAVGIAAAGVYDMVTFRRQRLTDAT